ncbi:hypothetical protein M409DRAFT_65554 [Zasmidium cellare ATCC 36951]|uniref:Flavin-nucleotide-binding protein n=1 Tax=Zasmidium cellare ATCC 36951 TaxID=1080233 RepID=A0A6A6CNJ2_ZASCE|nr:uncharacterized protein M409DRAFT_65554 [Zasmidium cellare ATCC 36951]KAF2168694.1 hypothetical protein M409DRAFT_65554 [Zasmidium cellare ATCC 36951]
MTYSILPENQVNRLRNRAKYDYETVHGIVAATPVLHVSFCSGDEDAAPTILPMIGALGTFPETLLEESSEVPDLYLHGSTSARLLKERGKEVKVCVAATKVDGYVLALTPFHHSYNFRSAILHGSAEVVKDEQERLFAMELITDKVVPGQWRVTRTPPTKVELQSTQILRVRINTASAKVRWGTPNADRRDLKDSDLIQRCWSGVVPMWETYGEPVSGPDNQAPIPQHVVGFVSQANAANESVAYTAAQPQ